MREIFFKAKRADNGEWVEGDLLHKYNSFNSTDIASEALQCTFQVNPETVCQYIGLTDINGNRIWENDIVRDKFNNIYVVDYCNEWGVFRLNLKVGLNEEGERARFIAGSRDFIGSDWRNHLVIGNIFDNPELLEVWK